MDISMVVFFKYSSRDVYLKRKIILIWFYKLLG